MNEPSAEAREALLNLTAAKNVIEVWLRVNNLHGAPPSITWAHLHDLAEAFATLLDSQDRALAEKDAVLADTQRELLNWKSRGPKTVVDALTEAWHKLENVEAELAEARRECDALHLWAREVAIQLRWAHQHDFRPECSVCALLARAPEEMRG